MVGTVLVAAALAACGSASPVARRASSTTAAAGASSGGRSSGSASTTGGSGSGAGQAENLPVTSSVRAELLGAGATLHSLPSSDYTGLVPGTTYYARDLRSGDLWAGAGLVPAANSYDAGVRNQDEGAYMILTRPPNGTWHGWETGLTGGPPGPCPVTVPSAVLAVWGWAPGTCYPPSGAQSQAAGASGPTTAQPCGRSQVTARLVGTSSAQAQYRLDLVLTNRSATTCTLTGFPGVELVGPVSNGSTTYDPVRQQVSYRPVTVPAGASAHAALYALPGPDSCDAGTAWVPTGVRVTLPGATDSFPVTWPGGSVDNCQGGATHPGTFVGPVESGAS